MLALLNLVEETYIIPQCLDGKRFGETEQFV